MSQKQSAPRNTASKLRRILTFILLVLVVTYAIDRSRRHEKPAVSGEINRLLIGIGSQQIELKKTGTAWNALTLDGNALNDPRVNDGLIEHLVSLMPKASEIDPAIALEAKDAGDYGMRAPVLSIAFSWDLPQPGENIVLFGNHDLTGSRVFAFFPKIPLLAPVGSAPLELLKNMTVLDLRMLTMSKMTADSVLKLSMDGHCTNRQLVRQGSTPVWKSGSPFTNLSKDELYEHTNEWLHGLLETNLQEEADPALLKAGSAPLTRVCRIKIEGVSKPSTETISIFRTSTGDLILSNALLPSTYKAPQTYLRKYFSELVQ